MRPGFRLGRLARLRRQEREGAQAELALASARVARLRAAIAAVRASEEAAAAAEATALGAGMTAAELRQARACAAALRARAAALADEEHAALAEEAARRETLLERRRAERQLEILSEQAWQRWRADGERLARLAADDVTMGRHRRGRTW